MSKHQMATAGRLSTDQVRAYEREGYLLVKGVFTRTEMAAMREETHRLAARREAALGGNPNATWESVRDGTFTIKHCHDVQFYSAAFTRLISDPRLLAPLQSLIGENIQLHHTKMFIKPPEQGSPFPMHQDHPYFPHERHTMTAAIIHFDDAPVEKGCVRVYPGTHKLGPIDGASGGDHHLPFEEFPIEGATPCPAEAGDVLIFNYLTVHGSGVNTSQEARTTLLLQVRDPLDRPLVRAHESPGQGTMLAGIDPSCAAISEWERRFLTPA